MKVASTWRRMSAALIGLAWIVAVHGTASAADGRVIGKVQYEKILHRDPVTGVGGLQLGKPILRPVANARVELVDGTNILVSSTTDARGEYQLPWSFPVPPTAYVRVLAEADNAVVVDHYDPAKVYSVRSDAWTLTEGEVVKDILAIDKTRESGPFNILAIIQIGNDLIRSAEKDIEFPKLKIHWTTRPRPGTSYFVNGKSEAYILGFRDEDSDEFDDFIILHEYGHYLMNSFSKDSSPGGNHGRGDRLDPRLAWGEGWGNFFACAALNDPRYLDTGLSRFSSTGVRVEFNLDEDRPSGDRAGYWSEHSVGSTLWDLFDKKEGKNHMGLGFAEIWKVLRSKHWLDRGPFWHLIDFCDALVEMRPETAEGVTKILAARGIRYNAGKVPSVEDGYVRHLKNGIELKGEVNSIGIELNKLDAKNVFTFTLTEKTRVKLHMDITASKDPTKADIDLFLLDAAGRHIAKSDATNGVGDSETIEIELAPGKYHVEVLSYAFIAGRIVPNTGTYRIRADY